MTTAQTPVPDDVTRCGYRLQRFRHVHTGDVEMVRLSQGDRVRYLPVDLAGELDDDTDEGFTTIAEALLTLISGDPQ